MNEKQVLCDLCAQREATVHLTQTTETETRQVHLADIEANHRSHVPQYTLDDFACLAWGCPRLP